MSHHPPEICKRCGVKVTRPWGIHPMAYHQCRKGAVKVRVYTDEEKREFERKRKAGEI